ncbi:MAG: heme-binding protein [Halioglobus sp.]
MANSTEEPKFELLTKVGTVEIRQYAPTIQAVTATPDRSGGGFRRLAGYIFGGNESDQSIAMTAPVQETMGSANGEMAFTMPSEYSMDDLPDPKDENVTLRPVPERTMAVMVFSGRANDAKAEKKWVELEAILNDESITTVSDPMLNQYNPPWTLPFLRRNEVMVEIAASSLPGTEVGTD